jgi:endonuclease III
MTPEAMADKQKRALEVISRLKAEYPDPRCTLDFQTPHQLLVAAILAAQCTDERVNETTPALFARYPTVEAFANADGAEMEEMVKPTGFFRNKTKAAIESARQLLVDFDGKMPDTIDELVTLSGVGRKTANLITGEIFHKPSIVVDTHVKRVTGRLEFTDQTDPTKIEFQLRELLPEDEWTTFNHLIVAHGRAVCKAPTPLCERCVVLELCPFGQERMALRLKG